jgi:hypothetical protein
VAHGRWRPDEDTIARANKLKSRAEDASLRWPHAAMLHDGEQREECPGDQEVRDLNPAVRKRGKRADRHRDVAVLRLQQSLHDDKCCKQEREHDAARASLRAKGMRQG